MHVPIINSMTFVNKFLLFFLISVTFQGCVKDKPEKENVKPVLLSAFPKVFIINEGNFSSGNSSVSMYDPASGNVVENFYNVQNSTSLGDVAQSMTYLNGKYYIVVNNSGKIIVCDNQFKKTGEISGLASPRYLLPVSSGKAYASDFKSNSVSIVDLNTNTKTGSIQCTGWTEKMVMLYGVVYITNMKRNYIYTVSSSTDKIIDSVYVGPNCGSLVTDKLDRIWALSSGDSKIPAAITLIHPVTGSAAVLSFPSGESPWNLNINRAGDTLYYLNNGICRITIANPRLPATPLIKAGTKNFYGLGVNPVDHNIYASDALDYTQRSSVYIYNVHGEEKKFFHAGINSNSFYFE
jgi:hypothetical protein